MIEAFTTNIHMWLTFGVILFAIVFYALELARMEMTSLFVIVALLLIFYLVPAGAAIPELPGARELLAGFADPALITVLALLVIGQALVRTAALDGIAGAMVGFGKSMPFVLISLILIAVMILSGFMNNTPVVVVFIPVLSALSVKLGRSVSKVMIPLSFAAILGGNLTIIGSSTNLLVSGALEANGGAPLGFFDLTVPGSVIAVFGLLYLFLIAPMLLTDRAGMAQRLAPKKGGRQFIVQVEIDENSPFLGMQAVAGMFPELKAITVRMIQRGEQSLLPPFDETEISRGDKLVIAATRSALSELLTSYPQVFSSHFEDLSEEDASDASEGVISGKDQMLAEALIAPASRMSGLSLREARFHTRTGCTVLGIQRRERMLLESVENIKLESGDVLLVLGARDDVLRLRHSRNVMLMEWSATDVARTSHANHALIIFAGVVVASATGLLPIIISSMLGAVAMIATGCINLRQAGRAMDTRIIMLVAAALAMGQALGATGGGAFLAHGMLDLLEGASTTVILSAFFLMVAIITNILSNNATAVLFTPIALSMAARLGVDPMAFVIAVIMGANCSFATPISFKTNLLVMAPGHYRFSDYAKTGIPLILIIWAVYSLFAPWYYGF